jgi:anti-sigma regulatory factor (Ser/Thr protein kinase)
MLTAHTTLPGLTSSVPTARRFAEQVLAGWGHPDAGWTAAQVISELAANCALHARTTFTVTVTAGAEAIRLEVQDGSPAAVQPRSYSETATTGRGLRMVQHLAIDWGVTIGESGKTVWVLLPIDGPRDDERDLEALLEAFDDADGSAVPIQPSTGRGPAACLRLSA